MPHEVEVDANRGFVCARYSGTVTLQERLQVARKMLDEAQAAGTRRFLVDFRNAHGLDRDLDGCVRVADYGQAHLAADSRLAYLLRYDHQLDATLEDVLRARGITVARFVDPTEATEWLQAPVAPRIALQDPTHVGRAFQLVAEVVDPATPISPHQFAAIGEMVTDLLEKGVDESSIRQLAARMWAAMRAPPID